MSLHHYLREHDGRVARYHLRVEPDGAGLLLANATAAVRLSPSGVAMARALLSGAGAGDQAIAEAVAREFSGADPDQVEEDVLRVRRLLDEMIVRAERFPLRDLDDPDASVYRRALSAPLGADVHGGDGERVPAILDALWAAGVPQVVFAVPDPVARELAVRWVERAEDLGMIAGVRGRAGDLGSLDDLAAAGLDHVDLLCAGAGADDHDRIAEEGDFAALCALLGRARALELFPVAWIPVLASSLETFDEVAAAAAGLGAGAFLLAPIAAEEPGADDGAIAGRALPQAAALAEETAERLGVPMVWAPPLERDPALGLAEQVRRGPRAAGEASIRVEARGEVLPPVGAGAAGNLLDDPWERIWGHAAFEAFREASEAPPRCATCPGLAVCAAGCPGDRATWALRGARDRDRSGGKR
jgi:radical SAM protein with 4Fe4S-binding SPASM domain